MSKLATPLLRGIFYKSSPEFETVWFSSDYDLFWAFLFSVVLVSSLVFCDLGKLSGIHCLRELRWICAKYLFFGGKRASQGICLSIEAWNTLILNKQEHFIWLEVVIWRRFAILVPKDISKLWLPSIFSFHYFKSYFIDVDKKDLSSWANWLGNITECTIKIKPEFLYLIKECRWSRERS